MGEHAAELPGYGSSLAWSLVSLAVVCLLAYVLLRWLGRRGIGQSDERLRVLGRCHLESRRSVYLVEAAGRCFLLGAGDASVTLLAEIDKAALSAPADMDEKPAARPSQVLVNLLRRRRP